MEKQATLDIGLLIHQFLVWTTVRVRLCCGATCDSITTCENTHMDTNSDRKQNHKAAKKHHCKAFKPFIKFLPNEMYEMIFFSST